MIASNHSGTWNPLESLLILTITRQSTKGLRNQWYQVQLPWKEAHPHLTNHHALSLNRLQGLMRRLQQEPDVPREYASKIKGQIEQGIMEPVEESSEELSSQVHYLPHHAVI